jgi:hypothetical protein
MGSETEFLKLDWEAYMSEQSAEASVCSVLWMAWFAIAIAVFIAVLTAGFDSTSGCAAMLGYWAEGARQRTSGFGGGSAASFCSTSVRSSAAFRISALTLVRAAATLRSSCDRVLSAAARFRND